LVGLGFEVCRSLRDEEALLKSRFGEGFVVNFTSFVARGVSRVLRGEAEPDARFVKAAYECWFVLALINLSAPTRVVDPGYEGFKENCGFWFKRRYRLYGVHLRRANGSPVRDQIPTNVI